MNESLAMAVEHDIACRILGSIPSEVEIHLAQSGINCHTYFGSVTFVANFIVNSFLCRKPNLTDFDVFIDIIKQEHILSTIPVIFSTFRKMRIFEIEKLEGYEALTEMIMICLTESQNIYNVAVPMDLINLANTYYFGKNEENDETKKRLYLMESVKSHEIFKKPEFWEGFLLRGVDISRKTFDFNNYSGSHNERDFLKEISDSFFNIAMMMKEIVTNQKQIYQLLSNYFKAYKLPKSSFEKLKGVIKGKILDG